jgi:hypothetical protein
MAWSVVPNGVRATALKKAQEMLAAAVITKDRRETVDDCEVHIGLITVDNKRWAMVSVKPSPEDGALRRKIAGKDTLPFCHWD